MVELVAQGPQLLHIPSHCRYGVWGDWDTPYVTLDPKYEAAQLRVFGKMVLDGHIYRRVWRWKEVLPPVVILRGGSTARDGTKLATVPIEVAKFTGP